MHALITYNYWAGRTVALCALCIACLIFSYGTFLLLAVSHAARASEAQQEIRALSQELSALEEELIAQGKRLTPELGQDMGFETPRAVSVVYAQTPVLSLGR